MIQPRNDYYYPGPNDDCRNGQHVVGHAADDGAGPMIWRCGECGVKLCDDFHALYGDDAVEYGEGWMCCMPDGHTGWHENIHGGEWR